MKQFKFTIKGHNYDVELQKYEDNIAEIEVNGTQYIVEVHTDIIQHKTPKLVRTAVPQPTRSETKIKKRITTNVYTIKAPLPGNIIQIFAKEGDTVKTGDKLLIYEAMKMENNILAEKDGQIKLIKVAPGESVLQGDVLIEMV
ncbi:MAG: biotin/lipoyl-binding protein [Bacteroidales bacterium]|nr:biotin/lipoyl-binding protein [Bacteroidales bacterium]